MIQCSNGLDMGIQRSYFISGIALLDAVKPSRTNMLSVPLFLSVQQLKPSGHCFSDTFLANHSLQKSLSKDFSLLDLLKMF